MCRVRAILILSVSLAVFGCVLESGEQISPVGPSSTSVVSPDGALPVSDFTVTPAAPEQFQSVFFASSSVVRDQSFSWDFGDGASATGDPVSHTYREPLTYRVTLRVVDAQGRSGWVAKTVTVSPPSSQPEAVITFSPGSPLVGQTVFFDGISSTAPAGRSIDGYVWNFGDGETQTGPHRGHIYSTAGTFLVRLTVTDSEGFSASKTQEVKVTASATPSPPEAVIIVLPTNPAVDQTVFFDGTTSTASAGRLIETYAWEFGDGGTASGPSPEHSYSTANTFVVRLTVTDSEGVSDSTIEEVEVS